MSNIKNSKKIALIYISILMFSFICNVESKLFQFKLKKNLGTRKASYLQQDVESLKDAFNSFFKIGTSVSPFEFGQGAEFIKKHFNSILSLINKRANLKEIM